MTLARRFTCDFCGYSQSCEDARRHHWFELVHVSGKGEPASEHICPSCYDLTKRGMAQLRGKLRDVQPLDFQKNPQWHNLTAQAVMQQLADEGMLAPALTKAFVDMIAEHSKRGTVPQHDGGQP